MTPMPLLPVDKLVSRLRDATGVDLAFGGAVGTGVHAFAINQTSGTETPALNNLLIREGLGLGGKAMSLRRPVAVRDYHKAGGITHQYDRAVEAERLCAVFAIPVVVGRTTRAVVYGGLRRPGVVGGRVLDSAVRTVTAVARDAEVAEEVERRLAEQQREREQPATRPVAVHKLEQRLREAQAEIDVIAQQVADPAVRARLETLSRGLCAPLAQQAKSPLSPREIDVLVQVAAGYTNREVADRLHLLPTTVKAYLQSAMRKLGTANRVATVGQARKLGILP
ncbi:helix-turn-helix transcriptional regulator [Streptomyces sp. ME19-01-6]|uniref:helix-turn-helix transcriptional regulator n=1 Tax=Streptomyces sp. ME19-01-6 TaxID=3028686 RepID=UPI0029B97097|nr:LuxR C-terminal-related transcriptional regulator [Streptomyces sp. ME19-01-6]MDX3225288.1 LuxR C-terminal-related transcriptional regulator [Streptomyces sp. ME19-01-6]